ncbi:MAG: hypothetical protein ACRCXZ_03455 [Patescibacteria group bacterium]
MDIFGNFAYKVIVVNLLLFFGQASFVTLFDYSFEEKIRIFFLIGLTGLFVVFCDMAIEYSLRMKPFNALHLILFTFSGSFFFFIVEALPFHFRLNLGGISYYLLCMVTGFFFSHYRKTINW